MRAGVIKRVRAAPAPATSDVTVIDRPNDAACGLPASRRLCVSTTCGAALTPRLQGGEEHATRCAFDSGGLVLDDSWLRFRTPPPAHYDGWGGFMLGLGLAGHLGREHRMQLYKLLASAHDMLTVGILLGLGSPGSVVCVCVRRPS